LSSAVTRADTAGGWETGLPPCAASTEPPIRADSAPVDEAAARSPSWSPRAALKKAAPLRERLSEEEALKLVVSWS
jgi:hypothetical protein